MNKKVTFLGVLTVFVLDLMTSPDANVIILSPGFDRRIESGENRDEVLKDYGGKCGQVYHNIVANHILTIDHDFTKLQVSVKSDAPDPVIIIQAAGQNPICRDDYQENIEIILSMLSDEPCTVAENVENICLAKAGQYLVWVGDKGKDDKKKYRITVSEKRF